MSIEPPACDVEFSERPGLYRIGQNNQSGRLAGFRFEVQNQQPWPDRRMIRQSQDTVFTIRIFFAEVTNSYRLSCFKRICPFP